MNDLETVFPIDNVPEEQRVQLKEATKEFRHTDKYMREHNDKMNAKKSKSVIKPEPKYFSESTQKALYEGKEVALLGVQATSNKFIVQNTYFQGRLDQAREQYNKYFNDIKVINKKLGEGNWKPTLTWENWLSTWYVASQLLERKIDVE